MQIQKLEKITNKLSTLLKTLFESWFYYIIRSNSNGKKLIERREQQKG